MLRLIIIVRALTLLHHLSSNVITRVIGIINHLLLCLDDLTAASGASQEKLLMLLKLFFKSRYFLFIFLFLTSC